MVEEQYYRRLLRWYPRSWRAHHGEVLLGIMLDEAEALGRSRPTVGGGTGWVCGPPCGAQRSASY